MSTLDVPMQDNDAGAATIREYLYRLLLAVWEEGEGFSGKRPFGNSGWEHELYVALAIADLIEGSKDEWNEWDYDTAAGNELIDFAIKEMCGVV